MKTALNEHILQLIEMKNYAEQQNWDGHITAILTGCLDHAIESASSFLEKERQQIIEAGNKCAFRQHLYEAKIDKMTNDELLKFSEQKTDTVGEDYYNETFKNEIDL